MFRSAVTISLVPEARGGPFVFWDDLAGGCRKAAELGFDAVEIFPPAPDTLAGNDLPRLLADYHLKTAAVGTGAGWVKHKLSLTAANAADRMAAKQFVRSMIDAGGALAAPAIIGSMQGRWGGEVSQADALKHLADALEELGAHANQYKIPLLYEPLNRYETNLVNTLDAGMRLLESLSTRNVKLLADLFHMNLEESNLAAAIRAADQTIGHVHFADSNRRPAGLGHTDFAPIAAALRDIGYNGYLSAEVLPWPDSDSAAQQTIRSFRRYFSS